MCCLFIISAVLRLFFHSTAPRYTTFENRCYARARGGGGGRNLLINSTILSTLIDDDSFLLHIHTRSTCGGNFSFIELDRLCNSLEAKVFQLILAVLRVSRDLVL